MVAIGKYYQFKMNFYYNTYIMYIFYYNFLFICFLKKNFIDIF